MFKTVVATLLIVASQLTLAEGNPVRGKELTETCVACHSTDGNSLAGAFPSIAGQQSKYMLKQLQDIKSGERSAPLMTGFLDNMTEQDLEDISAYYAEQRRKAGAAEPDLVAQGEAIYRAGIRRKGITACTACHLPSGEGANEAGFPALAAQWPEYTEAQLKAFRSGERHNDGDGMMMRTTARDLSDDEIKAVASYLYGLQ